MKLESGSLHFSDITSPEDAQRLVRDLRYNILPIEVFYFTLVESNETGTTISFRRRSQP